MAQSLQGFIEWTLLPVHYGPYEKMPHFPYFQVFFSFFCIPNMRILTPIPIIDSKRAILHIQIRSLFTVVPNFALPPTPIRTRLFSPVPNINSLWKSGLKFWFYYCVPSQKYGFFASGHFCIFPILQNWIQQKPQKPNWLMTSFMNGP